MLNIKKFFKKTKTVLYWFLSLFLKNPKFEYYVLKKNRLNEKYYQQIIDCNLKSNDAWLKPFSHVEVPKIIWVYWAQGEENMPFIVKACVETWKIKNVDWDVRICSDVNISTYLDDFSFPNHLPYHYRADFVRLALIEKFGGVWVDSTCYCHRPLDEWLPLLAHSGFFVFRNPAEDRDIENWFIAAAAGHPLIVEWKSFYENYCNELKKVHFAYFINFYVFQFLIEENNLLRELDRISSGLNAGPSFFMMSFLENKTKIDDFNKHLNAGLPVSKLNWKSDLVTHESFSQKLNEINSLQASTH